MMINFMVAFLLYVNDAGYGWWCIFVLIMFLEFAFSHYDIFKDLDFGNFQL